jgi:methionyl-tRNA formyltransferase
MVQTLRGLESGEVQPRRQDHSRATLAPILKKEDGRMDFSCPASELFNRLRGFRPWPGASATFRTKTLQVHRAEPVETSGQLAPGAIAIEGTHLIVGCGQGTALNLIEIQIEGKRRMTAQEFINGYHPQSGDHLGT